MARHRFDEPRIFRRVAERFAEAADGVVQAILKVYKSVVRPESFLELLSVDHFARMLKEG